MRKYHLSGIKFDPGQKSRSNQKISNEGRVSPEVQLKSTSKICERVTELNGTNFREREREVERDSGMTEAG